MIGDTLFFSPMGMTKGVPLQGQGLYSFGVEPDVYLNFAAGYSKIGGVISPVANQLTCVRASTRYIGDISGNWTLVAANLSGISNRGLLVEEARTNSLRNSSMQGAVVGTPGTLPTNWGATTAVGGMSSSIVGFGTQNGIDYIDIRWFGTAATSGLLQIQFDTNQGIAAATGQTWSESVFVALVGGSITNLSVILLDIDERGGGGGHLSFNNGPDIKGILTNTLQRFSFTATLSNAGTSFACPFLNANTVASGAIDITLRIGWPQLEQGAFATSPIRTTAAAVTRSADVVTLTSLPTLGSAYSLYGAGSSYSNTLSVMGGLFGASDNDRIQLARSGTPRPNVTMSAGGSNFWVADYPGVTWTSNLFVKMASAYASADHALTANGGVPATDASVGTPALTQFRLGNEASGVSQWNGYMTEAAIWAATRLTNAQLQAGTT